MVTSRSPVALDVFTPRPFTRSVRPDGRAGRDADPDLVAVDGGNLDFGAQGSLREGDRDVDAEVVAVAGVESHGA